MLPRITLALAALLLACVILFGGITYWATPTIVVQNSSQEIVQVIAHWDTRQELLPPLPPEATYSFKVAGESSMVFVVTFPDGRQEISTPMYFTTTTTLIGTITNETVAVTAEF